MFDVAGFGASSIDLVYVLPAYPAPDASRSKLPIQSHFISPGGQTATAMAACAALGLRTAFIGHTGADAHGARIREELTRHGVDIEHASIGGPQPYAVILLVEGQGERIVLWHRDTEFSPVGLPRLREHIEAARLLHVDDSDVGAAIDAATIARAAGRLVTTDIDRVTDRTRELIALATHPVLAEHVPAQLTGEHDLERALRGLRSLTSAPIIVTRGSSGAVALDGGAIIEAPGFHVEAVDTTGAGDVFRAGLITAILEGEPLRGALRYANATAAASCTKRGAMSGVPARGEVDQILRG